MALTKGKRVAGSGFLNLKDLVKDSKEATLVIFRVKEFLPAEKATGFAGVNLPVICDAAVCSGPRKGEVWADQKFFGAISGPLRGVPNAKTMKDVLDPETEIGEEIVLRVKLVNEGKSNEGAVGDEPTDLEMEAAAEIYNDGAVWDLLEETGEAEAPAKEKVGAGAGKTKRTPW